MAKYKLKKEKKKTKEKVYWTNPLLSGKVESMDK